MLNTRRQCWVEEATRVGGTGSGKELKEIGVAILVVGSAIAGGQIAELREFPGVEQVMEMFNQPGPETL